jgi:hypothetical protein
MRLFDIINEGRDAVLWHGYKEAKHALSALRSNAMLGTSTQRWWPDDKHHRDDEGEVYHKSYWMKGISMTRDRLYAQSWGRVVFCLDQRLIAQNYKIIPFSWSKTFGISDYTPHHKREREEYVILEREPDTYLRDDPDDGTEPPRFDTKEFMAPAKKRLEPLRKFLIGIWTETPAIFDEDIIAEIEADPLFKGHYKNPNRKPYVPK